MMSRTFFKGLCVVCVCVSMFAISYAYVADIGVSVCVPTSQIASCMSYDCTEEYLVRNREENAYDDLVEILDVCSASDCSQVERAMIHIAV